MKSTNRILALLGIIAATSIILTGCSSTDTKTTASDTLTLGSTATPLSWDTAVNASGPAIPYLQALYDTLITRAPDGALEPRLATSWTYNAEMTQLTMKLRTDVTFTDGTVFDSSAVKANLEHVKAGGGIQSSQMASLKDIQTPDATTAVIDLTAPDPAFLVYLTDISGFMQNPKAIAADTLKTVPDGSGPYILDAEKTVSESTYVFTRNPKYWGDKLPYNTVVIKYFNSDTAQLNALVSGQINSAVLVQPANAAAAERAGLTAVPSQVDWQGLYWFDRAGKVVPALANVQVRQALNYAIDRETLLSKIQQGMGTVTSQIWGPASLGYDESLDSYYDYNPAKAKQLMSAAGYADGFSLTIPYLSGTPETSAQAVITQQLGEIGVKVEWHQEDPASLGGDLYSGKFGAVYMQLFQPTDWYLIQQSVVPNAAFNFLQYSDPRVDSDVQDFQFATTADDQKAIAQQLNRYVTEQAWYDPLFRVTQLLYTDEDTTVVPQVEQGTPSLYNYSPKD